MSASKMRVTVDVSGLPEVRKIAKALRIAIAALHRIEQDGKNSFKTIGSARTALTKIVNECK